MDVYLLDRSGWCNLSYYIAVPEKSRTIKILRITVDNGSIKTLAAKDDVANLRNEMVEGFAGDAQ